MIKMQEVYKKLDMLYDIFEHDKGLSEISRMAEENITEISSEMPAADLFVYHFLRLGKYDNETCRGAWFHEEAAKQLLVACAYGIPGSVEKIVERVPPVSLLLGSLFELKGLGSRKILFE